MSEKHAIIFTANEAFPLIIPRQKYFFKNNPWGIISECGENTVVYIPLHFIYCIFTKKNYCNFSISQNQ